MRYFRWILQGFILLLGALLTGAALKFIAPETYSSLALSAQQRIGFTDETEVKRRQKIVILPISDEKKSILISGKIFEGATTHMAELALGQPRQVYPPRVKDGRTYTYWQYHFTGDNRPTVLIFENGKLSGAQKMPARTASMQ